MSTNRPPAGHDDTGHEHHDRGAPASHSLHDTHHEHAGRGMPAGHDRHAGHSVAMFRDKFWISLLLTIPTLVWGDRKSTRLNSSHRCISYAVFCLKKKKNKITRK